VAADTIDVVWTTPTSTITLAHEGPYRVADITGWEDSPGGRVDDQARANAHGSHDAPVYATARTVTVEGYCISVEDRATLITALRRAVKLGGANPPGTLTVTFADRTLTATGRVARASNSLRNWGVGHFGWVGDWWCPDPLRYDTTRTASTALPSDAGGMAFPLFDTSGVLDFGGLSVPGNLTLDNPGDADTWPTLTVTGPMPGGFELVELATGRRLRWESDVPSGVAITLTTKTGAVAYDGVPGYDGQLTARQWWPIPAGETRTVQITPLGAPDPAARLAASWAPAYW
jgi:hypothetical protein